MATYLLIHGGFSGGWVWRDVANRLRSAGHEVFTPTLTGLGERAHLATPEVSLATHIQDVIGVCRCDLKENIILHLDYRLCAGLLQRCRGNDSLTFW